MISHARGPSDRFSKVQFLACVALAGVTQSRPPCPYPAAARRTGAGAAAATNFSCALLART